MVLEALEFHVGGEMRVFVVQMNDKAHVNLVVVQMIDKAAATGVAAQRPAHRVGDPALAVLFGVDLPDFLHAQAVFLRTLAARQVKALDHLFR